MTGGGRRRDELFFFLPAGKSIFSPWFPREFDFIIATADLISLKNASLTVRCFTKSQDDTGDGTSLGDGFKLTVSSIGRASQEWGPHTGQGLGELYRYQFTSEVDQPVAGLNWVLFRMLDPVWFDAVRVRSPVPP